MTPQKTEEESITISYLALRKAVGIIGLGVPTILALTGMIFLKGGIEPSISHFYYTSMGDFFVGSLCAIGVFLISYRGYKPQYDEKISDRTLGWITGAAAIAVALFPTDPLCVSDTGQALLACPVSNLAKIHFTSAAVFLFGLGVFSFFKFPRYYPDIGLSTVKAGRVKYYRACGIAIFVSLVAIALLKLYVRQTQNDFPLPNWMFWFESIAVVAFGISWLIKGESIETVKTLLGRTPPST
jgi:hypothetical protein